MKNKNFDEIIRFCFNELPEERQRQIECQLLHDDVLFDVISGVFRVKREFTSKAKVLEYFSAVEQKARDKLFPQKAV